MNRRDFDIDHIDPRWEEGRDYQLVCGLDCLLNLRESDPSFNSSKSNRFLPWRWSQDEIGVVPEEPGDLAYFLVGSDIETDTPGEWVLMEFLSEEWFEASKGTCAGAHRKVPVNVEALAEGQRKFRENNPERYKEVIENFISIGRKWIDENKDLHTALVKKGVDKLYEENPSFGKERHEKMMDGFREWKAAQSEEEWANRNQSISVATREAMQRPEVKAKLKDNGKAVTSMRYRCRITGYESTPQWVTIHQRKLGIEPTPENRIRIN